jgi:26S proteasome regulatory subunit N13
MAVGGPLFGNTSSRSASKALVEFRAGKMNLDTSSKMVTADARKGTVAVYQNDDQLMHFTWKDRGTGTVEEDLTIFPDDCEFVNVPACTTGRVYVLKFKTCSKRMFFWMQEPKSDKDEDLCKKINDALNNPPAPGSSRSSGTSGGALSGVLPLGFHLNNVGDSDLQSMLNNMSKTQLMQIFGGVSGGAGGSSASLASLLAGGGGAGSGGSSTRSRQAAGTGRPRPNIPASPDTPAVGTGSVTSTPATPVGTGGSTAIPGSAGGPAANSAIQLSDLQSILSNIQVPAGAEGIGAGEPAVDLASGLTSETLQPLLSNPEFLEKVKEFIPKEEKKDVKDLTAEDLKDTVQSPQFKQAVSMFSMAFNSGQLGPLVREFGLSDSAIAAADKGNMQAFVQALQKDKKVESTPGAGDKKKDDAPEDMALD